MTMLLLLLVGMFRLRVLECGSAEVAGSFVLARAGSCDGPDEMTRLTAAFEDDDSAAAADADADASVVSGLIGRPIIFFVRLTMCELLVLVVLFLGKKRRGNGSDDS
jgi:hypothetical protein